MSYFSFTVPVANMNDLSHLSLMGGGGKDTLWIEGNWGTSKQLQACQLNDSNYSQVDSRSLSTFYSARKEIPTNPTPYATTTLINNLIPNNRIDSSVCILKKIISCNLSLGGSFYFDYLRCFSISEKL